MLKDSSVVIAKFVSFCRELGMNERDLDDTGDINCSRMIET